jgi:peptidoglycan/xylan/chitin deacetylase (PgdA/CDA1 family)
MANQIGGETGLILMFHYIRPPIFSGVSDDLFLLKNDFEQILDLLVESFHPLVPEEFFERLNAGGLPRRAILLTFDDGSVDGVTTALPALQKRDLKACFFVCPELINRGDLPPTQKLALMIGQARANHYKLSYTSRLSKTVNLPHEITFDNHQSRVKAYYKLHPSIRKMHSLEHPVFFDYLADLFDVKDVPISSDFRLATWLELQQLTDAGMLVGNHTLTHSTISADGPLQFKQDVASAFEQLEPFQATSLKLFCFPYGRKEDVTDEAMSILREQNVNFALATQGGIASLRHSPRWSLRRESVSYSRAHFMLIPLIVWLRH